MKVKFFAGTCDNGDCPTVYETDRGTFVIQGYVVEDPQALGEIKPPAGETVIEVPESFLREIADKVLAKS